MKTILLSIFIGTLSFLFTSILIAWWIKGAKRFGFVGKDMNKYKKPQVAEAAGLPVILGISFSFLFYIFIKVFYLKNYDHIIETFAILVSLLLACLLGFIDDIFGWKLGLKVWQKLFFTIPVAIPLMVINAGSSVINLPLIGIISFGIFYPLIIVPIGIVGAANGFNMFAGYNGLEGGMGIIIISTLSFISWLIGNVWITFLGILAVISLISFLIFNWYPAKIFPGDSFTHSIGALIAMFAILGNMEKIAIFLFIPYFLDAFLYIRAIAIDRVGKVEAFAKPNEDGSLDLPYKKNYDLSHVSISILKKFKKKVYEQDVVLSLLGMELLISAIILAFYLY